MTRHTPHTPAAARIGQGGFTLMECLLATVVLSLIVLAVVEAVLAGQMGQYEALNTMRAASLGESLMEEVLSRPYADPEGATAPGADAGEDEDDRTTFDNIDDYHGFGESPQALRDAAGELLPTELQGFSRSVTVAYGSVTPPGIGGPVSGVTITVRVEARTGRGWSFERFVAEPTE